VDAYSKVLEATSEEELTRHAESLFGTRAVSAALADTIAGATSRQAVRYHTTKQGIKLSQSCAAALELIEAAKRILSDGGDRLQLRASIRATEQLVRLVTIFLEPTFLLCS